MHIPLPEFMTLYNEFSFSGTKNEDVCCSSVNTGLFSTVIGTNSVDWISCGHDHNNDFYGQYQGVNLAYGRKSGFGGYGPDGLQKGARVFEITLEHEYKVATWIRQEDGSIDW